MKVEVFSFIQGKRVRCQVLDHFEVRDSSESFALTFYPIVGEETDLPILIPLVFDSSLSKQEASYIDDEEEKTYFEELINQDNSTLIFEPLDSISFEVVLLDDEAMRSFLENPYEWLSIHKDASESLSIHKDTQGNIRKEKEPDTDSDSVDATTVFR